MPNLLLIESPGKLKKLKQILGSEWIIKASMGHIRELANDGEDALGFDLHDDSVECRYVPRSPKAKKVIGDLRQAVKQADRVFLATDEDREGETISWHLAEELKLKNPMRVTYSEITSQAVRKAIANPRPLDRNLVAAGRARDCLDKLVGYRATRHVVWELNIGAKSMGRVQSAALHLLCQREKEIHAFKPQDYWSIWVDYAEGFRAFYRAKLSADQTGESAALDDADAETKTPESDRITTQAEADRLVAIAQSHPHHVVKVEGKIAHQPPPPPFTTSTLQQAAGSKLRLTPDQTMDIAQRLYEQGFITYMRTDSVFLSDEAVTAIRRYLEHHDPENIPDKAAKHRSGKNAQASHEAIRPTDINQTPEAAEAQFPTIVQSWSLTAWMQRLDTNQLADLVVLVYSMIWHRAVASQCASAQLRKTQIVTQSGSACWEARGQVVEFAGYTHYWNNLSADSQLPLVQQNQSLTLKRADSDKKQTQPPYRYTEPKLVQLMERKGIGRPSTYAPTIKTLKDRSYAEVIKGKLQPTQLGLDLDTALEKLLPDLINPEFTAGMEQALDAVSRGEQNWEVYLTHWNREYFEPALQQAAQKLGTVVSSLVSSNGDRPKTASASATTAHPAWVSLTEMQCPSCGKLLYKVSSRSEKLKADHFLSCDSWKSGCGAALFWNSDLNDYELAHRRSSNQPSSVEPKKAGSKRKGRKAS